MKSCCVVNCEAVSGKGNTRFFGFPEEDSDDFLRREQWVKKVQEWNEDDTWQPINTTTICGGHFMFGEPDSNEEHPDYVPSSENARTEKTSFNIKSTATQRGLSAKQSKLHDTKDLHYEYSSIFMRSLTKLRLEDSFCDVRFQVVENTHEYEYNAHSIVVAAHSPVLHDYIAQCDPNEKLLRLSDTTKVEVELLLNYMYGILPYTRAAWRSLLDLADSYDITSVSRLYETWKGQQGKAVKPLPTTFSKGQMPKVSQKKSAKRSAMPSDDEWDEMSDGYQSPAKKRQKQKVKFQASNDDSTADGEKGKRFVCGVCSESFSNMKILFQHVKTHSDSKQSKPGPKCSKPKEKKKVIRTIYQCGKCSKQYTIPKELKEHLKTHSGTKDAVAAADTIQDLAKQYGDMTQVEQPIVEKQVENAEADVAAPAEHHALQEVMEGEYAVEEPVVPSVMENGDIVQHATLPQGATVLEGIPAGTILEHVPAGATVLEHIPAGATVLESAHHSTVLESVPVSATHDGVPAGTILEGVPAGTVLESVSDDTVYQPVVESAMLEAGVVEGQEMLVQTDAMGNVHTIEGQTFEGIAMETEMVQE